jgi:hypothetical protein
MHAGRRASNYQGGEKIAMVPGISADSGKILAARARAGPAAVINFDGICFTETVGQMNPQQSIDYHQLSSVFQSGALIYTVFCLNFEHPLKLTYIVTFNSDLPCMVLILNTQYIPRIFVLLTLIYHVWY